MMVETLITASPEFMNQLPPEEQKAYFTMALDFISERVGEQNILSAVVHMDERTPHMHLCFVPITPDNKLSAKTILGNQKSLSEWQTAYHERMSSRWNQLERGQSSMETKRKHVPTWLYKLGGRLDKQYGEIVSALSDINAFNAGKKRDKALELVAAWLPEVEKFSKEIGRQQAYIDSLKEHPYEASVPHQAPVPPAVYTAYSAAAYEGNSLPWKASGPVGEYTYSNHFHNDYMRDIHMPRSSGNWQSAAYTDGYCSQWKNLSYTDHRPQVSEYFVSWNS